MKTIAFAGSNSSQSINQKLVDSFSEQNSELDIEVIRLSNYDLPMFSEDLEKKGFPVNLKKLNQKIQEADFLIISTPEHNGNLPAFFKNILDWLSRLNYLFLEGKKVLIMSASPGKAGGTSALRILKNMLPHFGAEIVGEFSLGNFTQNYIVKDLFLEDILVHSLS